MHANKIIVKRSQHEAQTHQKFKRITKSTLVVHSAHFIAMPIFFKDQKVLFLVGERNRESKQARQRISTEKQRGGGGGERQVDSQISQLQTT